MKNYSEKLQEQVQMHSRLLPSVCNNFMNKKEVPWINYSLQVISPLLFISFDKTYTFIYFTCKSFGQINLFIQYILTNQ